MDPNEHAEPLPPKEWLQRKIDRTNLTRELGSDHSFTPLQAMIKAMQPGDELWTYESPKDFWEIEIGRAGYCLVRNGAVIAEVLTLMN